MLVAHSGHASSIFRESLAVAPSRHRCSHHHHPCVAKDLIWSKQQTKTPPRPHENMSNVYILTSFPSSCSKTQQAVVCLLSRDLKGKEHPNRYAAWWSKQGSQPWLSRKLTSKRSPKTPKKSLQVIGIETQHVGWSRIYGTALSNLRPWVLKSCWFELAQGVV